MPPKRLFDTPRDEPGRLLIEPESITPPRRSSGLCGLAVCLQSALQAASLSVSYAELMGLLNAAFLLRVDEDFSVGEIVESRWERLGSVLAELGFGEARVREQMPQPEIIAEELGAGRPLPALGWGEGGGDWSLICGQDADGKKWWGYEFLAAPVLVAGEASCRMLVQVGGKTGDANMSAARDAAIAAAGKLRLSEKDPVSAYDKWAELMRRGGLFPEGPAGDEMIMRHEWLTEVLLDARYAAADFLRTVADSLGQLVAEELVQAADLYDQVIGVLESRQPGLFEPIVTDVLRDAQVRDEWAELLQEAAELETEALDIIRRIGAAPRP